MFPYPACLFGIVRCCVWLKAQHGWLSHPPSVPFLTRHDQLKRPVVVRQWLPVSFRDHVHRFVHERRIEFCPGKSCPISIPPFSQQVVRCRRVVIFVAGWCCDLGKHVGQQDALKRDGGSVIGGRDGLLLQESEFQVRVREPSGSSRSFAPTAPIRWHGHPWSWPVQKPPD